MHRASESMVSGSEDCAKVSRQAKRSTGEGLQNANAGLAPAGESSWRATVVEGDI